MPRQLFRLIIESGSIRCFEFRKLEDAAMYAPLLEALVATRSTEKQVEIILKICGDLRQTLLMRGIVTGENDNRYLLPLFNAHLELLAKGNSD